MKADGLFRGHPSVPVVLAHILFPGPCYLKALNLSRPGRQLISLGRVPSCLEWTANHLEMSYSGGKWNCMWLNDDWEVKVHR